MPEIQRNLVNEVELVSNENKPFREKLFELFKAQDFVGVKNIDDEDFQWQYMPTAAEEIYQDGDQRLVIGRRSFNSDYSRMSAGKEEFWELKAGETEVLLGENAYIMIEGLYKRVVAKRIISKQKNEDYFDPKNPSKGAKRARNFNWGADTRTMDEIIDAIFLGVQTPQFESQSSGQPTSKLK